MSNTDNFINEVTEEVRRDRLFANLRRWGWVGGVIVLAIVAGAAWNEWNKGRLAAEAQARGDALLDAIATGTPEDRLAALQAAAVPGPVPGLLIAGQHVAAGDTAAGIAAYEAAAADASNPQVYRDLAALRALILKGGDGDTESRILALQQLALPGQTFAPLAQEQIIYAQIEAGDLTAARAMLETALSDAATPQGLRARLEALAPALAETATAQD